MTRTWWWRLLLVVLAPVWIPLLVVGLILLGVLWWVVTVPLLAVGNYVAKGDFDVPEWAK